MNSGNEFFLQYENDNLLNEQGEVGRMATKFVECTLKSEDNQYLDVKLPDGVPVIAGRGPLTRIKSNRCSKQHVKLTANYEQGVVEILQLGPNPSQVDNSSLRINTSITVSDGTVFNFLKGEFPYIITFVKETSQAYPFPKNCIDQNHDIGEQVNTEINGCQLKSSHCDSPEKATFETISDLKRKKEDSASETSSKHIKLEVGKRNDDNEDEEEHLKTIEEKLCFMQQKLAKPSEKNTEVMSAKSSPKKVKNDTSDIIRWEELKRGKLFLFTQEEPKASTKIAAFDLDHTIITTKTGKVFPTDTKDWRIMLPEIPAKLRSLIDEGYKIIIFTNQRNISKGRCSPSDFRKKLEHIGKKLGIPFQAFVSTGVGIYRKPAPGMWDILVKQHNEGIPVDLTSSFYCGDAAGRPASWKPGKRKDFSSSDRLFALNLKVQFYTPEEFFLGDKKAAFSLPKFDPRNFPDLPLAEIVKSSNKHCPVALDESSITLSTIEVVIFVGFPAAGKTHFAVTYLISKGYAHVNRDVLGNWQKCVSKCKMELDRGRSVIVDNTNPDVESRKRYVEIAVKYKIPCRCFLFSAPLEQAKHNNTFRQITASDNSHVGVNDMVINSYKSKYQEPELKEGFDDIVKVNFKPIFKNKEEERLYRMFLTDK